MFNSPDFPPGGGVVAALLAWWTGNVVGGTKVTSRHGSLHIMFLAGPTNDPDNEFELSYVLATRNGTFYLNLQKIEGCHVVNIFVTGGRWQSVVPR